MIDATVVVHVAGSAMPISRLGARSGLIGFFARQEASSGFVPEGDLVSPWPWHEGAFVTEPGLRQAPVAQECQQETSATSHPTNKTAAVIRSGVAICEAR